MLHIKNFMNLFIMGFLSSFILFTSAYTYKLVRTPDFNWIVNCENDNHSFANIYTPSPAEIIKISKNPNIKCKIRFYAKMALNITEQSLDFSTNINNCPDPIDKSIIVSEFYKKKMNFDMRPDYNGIIRMPNYDVTKLCGSDKYAYSLLIETRFPVCPPNARSLTECKRGYPIAICQKNYCILK